VLNSSYLQKAAVYFVLVWHSFIIEYPNPSKQENGVNFGLHGAWLPFIIQTQYLYIRLTFG